MPHDDVTETMFYLIALPLWILAAWRWGDWKAWRTYQSTILYFIALDILYLWLTHDYPLWRLQPTRWVPNHALAVLIEFGVFACTLLIFLGNYPSAWRKAIGWFILWIALYSAVEFVMEHIGIIKYFHGWTFVASILFNCVMFPMLRLHFKHPLVAYGLSICIAVMLLYINRVPIR